MKIAQPDFLHVRTLLLPLLTEYSVEWKNGALQYTTSSLSEYRTARVRPTAGAWAVFWACVDSAHVWDWEPVYIASRDFNDGTAWSVRLTRGEQEMESIGFNAYPRNGNTAQPTLPFVTFCEAVRQLIGGRPMGILE